MIIFFKTTTVFLYKKTSIFVHDFSQDISKNISDLKSVAFYSDADTDKASILADNRNKSGIYCWTNKVNGKIYIGSSINISVRMYKYYDLHYLVKSNRLIERALLAYGFSKFTLEIIEYCEASHLITREQYYIDKLNPEYNIVKKAGSTLGYKHTEKSL